MSPTRILFLFSSCTVAVCSALLLARAAMGRNPQINLECAVAVGALLVLLPRVGKRESSSTARWWPVALVLALAVIAFLPVVRLPLVTDDYIHILQIQSGGSPTPLGCLTQSCGGPRFYRPAGVATYWLEWWLWGTAAAPRHALDIGLHALSSVLFLLFARRVGFAHPFDLIAGLLFALHGMRPETVAWPAARFDTLALLFSLCSAWALLAARAGGPRIALAASVAAAGLACLSKESAFVLPLLLSAVLWFAPGAGAAWRLVRWHYGMVAAIFLWRWKVLGGIGGYWNPEGGEPAVFQLNALGLAKTFLLRIWAILWFPINWSRALEWVTLLALACGLAATLILLKARPGRRLFTGALIACAVACLPAHNMLLIGPALERSRYLALAAPFFLLALVAAIESLPRRWAIAAGVLLVLFHAGMLRHNLRIWGDVATARYELCRSLAARVRGLPGSVAVRGVPLTLDGVYWRNGLEDCLQLEFGVPYGKVGVNHLAPRDASTELRWNERLRRLE